MKKPNGEKHAAIYIRVSTDAQTEGYSVDAQKEQLTAYCIAKSIKNYEYYIDGGWTGSNLDRPEMKRLIKDAENGKLSHCIVFKLDRLSRSQRDTLYLIENVFIQNSVIFLSLNENLETDTPTGKAMIGIISAFAQLERENIRLRTRMGMKERVKAGYWMGGGRIPFGYDYDKNQGILVPNKDAEKVRQIYDLYINGYSGQNIANILGLKYEKLVTQILARKSNYGIIEYNGVEYQGRHEPLISKETYDLAMFEMAKRASTNIKSADYLLSGLVYCGKCGAKMRYQKWGKNGCKLVCYSQQKSKQYLVKDENCDQEKVWADEIEVEVEKILFRLKEQPQKDENATNVKSEPLISLLIKQREELERKIKKLYNLFAESEDEILLETINENKSKLTAINKRIDAENDMMNSKKNKEFVKGRAKNLETRWEHMTPKEKQTIVRSLVNKITINGEDVEIQLTF